MKHHFISAAIKYHSLSHSVFKENKKLRQYPNIIPNQMYSKSYILLNYLIKSVALNNCISYNSIFEVISQKKKSPRFMMPGSSVPHLQGPNQSNFTYRYLFFRLCYNIFLSLKLSPSQRSL